MISRISIKGLGPHENTVLNLADPMGTSTVIGRSEAGKSTLIDAVCFVLWGTDRRGRPIDLRAIRDGCDELHDEMTLGSGMRMVRTLRRKGDARGKTTRRLFRKTGEREYTTEKDWLGAIGGLGSRPRVLLQVLVPHAWVPLVEGEGAGRPFRDLLASILPRADKAKVIRDLVAEAGHEFRNGDPVNASEAEELRKRTKIDRSRQAGDAERLEQLIEVAERRETESGPDIGSARAVLELAGKWDVYTPAAEAHVEREEWAAARADTAEEWDADLAALGEIPPEDLTAAAAEGAARTQLTGLRIKRDEKQRHWASLRADAAGETESLTALEAAPPEAHPLATIDVERLAAQLAEAIDACNSVTDTCPTCERAGWDGAIAAVDAVRRQASESHAAAIEAADTSKTDRMTAWEDLVGAGRARLEQLQTDFDAANDELATMDAEVQRVEQHRVTARKGQAPRLAWEEKRKALRNRPVVPEPSDPPTAPTVRRPDAREVETATRTVEKHGRSQGAQTQRDEDLGSLREQLSISQDALETLMSEVDRLECLVDCIRRAPSVAARRQMQALGDISPVEIVLSEDGGAEVLVDGRPYHFASTGRRVIADVRIRHGLRTALGIKYLPLFVDCIQDVGGQVLPDRPPAILLRTTEDDLEVSR